MDDEGIGARASRNNLRRMRGALLLAEVARLLRRKRIASGGNPLQAEAPVIVCEGSPLWRGAECYQCPRNWLAGGLVDNAPADREFLICARCGLRVSDASE